MITLLLYMIISLFMISVLCAIRFMVFNNQNTRCVHMKSKKDLWKNNLLIDLDIESSVRKSELFTDQLQALSESERVAQLPQDLQQEIFNAPFPTSSHHVSTNSTIGNLVGRTRLAHGKIDALQSCQNNTTYLACSA